MAGIHLPVGIIEGFVTAAVLGYVLKIRPELAAQALGTAPESAGPRRSLAPVLASFAVAALLAGGFLVWFASTRPDGLEWSIARVTGNEEIGRPDEKLRRELAQLQQKTALLPDTRCRQRTPADGKRRAAGLASGRGRNSVAGFVGAILTLACAGLLGFVFTRRRKSPAAHRGLP